MPAAGASLLKQELGLSDSGFGFLSGTLFALSYAAGVVVIARFVGPRPMWRLLIGGIACWTLGTMGLGFVIRPEQFALSQVLVGIGQAAFVPVAVTLIADSRGQDRIARATARFTTASSLGRSSAVLTAGALIVAIGGVPIAHWLPTPTPWRAAFLMTALPNVALVLILLALRAGRRSVADSVRIARAAGTERPANARRLRIGLFVTASAVIVLVQSIAMWFPSTLVRLYGLDAGRAAMLAGVVTLLTVPAGQWLGGQLLDRIAWLRSLPTRAAIAGLALGACAISTVTVQLPLVLTLTALAVTNLSLGVAGLAGLAGLQRTGQPADRARTNGYFFATVTLVGLGAGPLLTGMFSDAIADPVRGLPIALASVALISLVVATLGHLLARSAMPKVQATDATKGASPRS